MRFKGNKKALMCLLICLFYPFSGFSQTDSYKANYSFVQPVGNQVASERHYENLIAIVKETYSSKNIFSNQSPFVIVPRISIISEKVAGEVQIVKVVKLEIGLTAQGKDDNYVFNKFKKVFTITADDSRNAISKALESIRHDPKIKTFIDQSNSSILSFYESNCSVILKTVKVNIDRQEYAKAFDYLRYVPERVSCFKEAEGIITKIYLDSKEENCRKFLQKAHNAEAQKDYNKALFYLQFVDTNVACYTDASVLVNKIGERVDEQVLRDFEMEKLVFSKLTDLKKMEIIAKEIDYLAVTVNE
ncbi:hypothetical protein FQU23_012970 [Flavobacterium sp. XN-5]|uniref:hypothetical protein n=1 Tax=Flavobacterium sp. XN-5 TaxID=2599390 RepID=UPI0011C81637|nr:hypothetical protein [Flavobacterium sp. XN-5]NGY38420.1 hypothetical protein [Flavobacterium sp. XN-5]